MDYKKMEMNIEKNQNMLEERWSQRNLTECTIVNNSQSRIYNKMTKIILQKIFSLL